MRSGPSARATRCRTLRQTKKRGGLSGISATACTCSGGDRSRAGRGRSCGQVAPSAREVGSDAACRTLGNIAFDRRKPEHALIAEPHPQRIDKLADIDFGAGLRHMRADRLPLGQRLDPGGGQRCLLDAEAGLDQHKALREKLGQMLRVPVRPRCADADCLRDIVDPLKHHIEPPRADAARGKIDHQLLA